MTRSISAAVFAFLAFTVSAHAAGDPAPIHAVDAAVVEKADKDCLDVVHRMSNDYAHFDAYYNSATKRVVDNVVFNADLEPRFQFNKCMATMGFPLGQ